MSRKGRTTAGAPHRMSPRFTRRSMASSSNPSAARSARHRCCIADSSATRRSSRTTKRQGVVWCGAGAVIAIETARVTAAGSTASSVKCRMVRREATASRAPSRRASAEPSGKRSSSRGRTPETAPGPSSTVTWWARPRTSATGTPPDLPLTRSAAEAISSATAMTVASIARPWASGSPRRSSSTVTPATPIAESVSPSRQGRPRVSVTTTPTESPVRSRSPCRKARADASESRGRSSTWPAGALLASMPAAASTSPWWVRTIRVVPRGVSFVATTVTVSASRAASR